MEKIIQLREYEYNELVSKANANEEEINKQVQEQYEKKGIVSLHVSLNFKNRYEYDDKIEFTPYAYVSDVNDKFPLSYESKKRLVEFAEKRITSYMTDRFGKNIDKANYLIDDIKRNKFQRNMFLGLTVTGWAVAVTLIAISLI